MYALVKVAGKQYRVSQDDVIKVAYLGHEVGQSVEFKEVMALGQGEDIILRSGVPAGTLVERGTVNMLGQTVSRSVLVYEGKDKAVLYNGARHIEAGDLRFLTSLNEFGRIDYKDVELPAELQIEVDTIVASLELTAGQ